MSTEIPLNSCNFFSSFEISHFAAVVPVLKFGADTSELLKGAFERAVPTVEGLSQVDR